LTDWRIQSQPARLFTLSGAAASFSSSASMAPILAAIVPYTCPSTSPRRYSKTRSAGFNSGDYGGCSINRTCTSSYAGPRWPRARSHTMTDTPFSPHPCTTGARDTPFISSVQSQRNSPVKPFTARFKYAHSCLYSIICTTLTPRGAQTRRTCPIKPTRISSPQYSPDLSTQPTSVSLALRPPFSSSLALQQRPWDSEAGALSSANLTGRTPSACPSKCSSHHVAPVPTPRTPSRTRRTFPALAAAFNSLSCSALNRDFLPPCPP